MPIDQLSDINQIPELLTIGRLFKGESKRNSPNHPVDLDHFRFETPYPVLAQRFQAIYGLEPQAVRCLLPYDDFITPAGQVVPAMYRCFDSWMKDFTGGKLQAQCTGTRMVRRIVEGRLQDVDEPCQCRANNKWVCKAKGILYVMIPELLPSQDFPQGMIGVVSMTTGSVFDNGKLARQITQILSIVREHGKRVQEVPLILSRRLESVPVPKSSQRQDKWLCNIALDPGSDLASAYLLSDTPPLAAIAAIPSTPPDDILQLPDGKDEEDEEEETTAPELSPPLPAATRINPVDVFKTAPTPSQKPPAKTKRLPSLPDMPMMPGDVPSQPVASYQINDQALAKKFFEDVREAYPNDKMTDEYILSQLLEMNADPLIPANAKDLLARMKYTLFGAYATIQKETGNYFNHENQLWNSITKAGVWGESSWPKAGDPNGWDIFITYGIERPKRDNSAKEQDPLFPQETDVQSTKPAYW